MTEPIRFSGRAREANNRGGRDTDLDICSDPAFATHPEDPLAEPRVVFQLWKGRQRNSASASQDQRGDAHEACSRLRKNDLSEHQKIIDPARHYPINADK